MIFLPAAVPYLKYKLEAYKNAGRDIAMNNKDNVFYELPRGGTHMTVPAFLLTNFFTIALQMFNNFYYNVCLQ